MSQHTSGPWHVLPRNRASRAGQPTFDVMAGRGTPENWDMIADRIDGEANARLIAKAPEMYELLKELGLSINDETDLAHWARALLQEIEREIA